MRSLSTAIPRHILLTKKSHIFPTSASSSVCWTFISVIKCHHIFFSVNMHVFLSTKFTYIYIFISIQFSIFDAFVLKFTFDFNQFQIHLLFSFLKLLRCCFRFSFSHHQSYQLINCLNVLINFEFSSGTLFNLNCIKLWTNQKNKWLIKENRTKKASPRKFPSTPNWKHQENFFAQCSLHTHSSHTTKLPPPFAIRPCEQSKFCFSLLRIYQKQTSQSRAKLRSKFVFLN